MHKILNSEQIKVSWGDLSDLITTMTPSEKGYFRKSRVGFTGQESASMRIFDVLERGCKPETAAIREATDLHEENIYSLRSFLYKHILRSLKSFHLEKSKQFALREVLDHAEILLGKGLHEQSKRYVQQGIENSDPHVLPAYQVLFRIQQIQLLKFLEEDEKITATEEIVDAISHSADIIKHSYIARRGLTKALYFVNRHFPLRDDTIKQQTAELLNELLAIPDDPSQNYLMRNSRNAAISLLYRLLGNWDAAITFQEKTIRIIEQVDAQLLNRNIPVINSYYYYVSLLLNKGDEIGFNTAMAQLEASPVSGKAEIRYKEAIVLQLKLDKCIFTKQFSEGAAVVQEAEQFLTEAHPIPGLRQDMVYRLLVYYIFTRDFDTALSKLLQLLHANEPHTLRSFPVHLRLLQILIHFELKHYLLLPSLIRNTYRFMMQQELYFEVERVILNFFKRILSKSDQQALSKEFAHLLQQFNQIENDYNERLAMHTFFDYKYWVERLRG